MHRQMADDRNRLRPPHHWTSAGSPAKPGETLWVTLALGSTGVRYGLLT